MANSAWMRVTHGLSVPSTVSDPQRQVLTIDAGAAAKPRRIWYTFAGPTSGPLLVAIHGSPGSTFDFRYLGAELEPTVGFLRFDSPGHGHSDRTTTYEGQLEPEGYERPDTNALAEDTWAAIDAVRAQIGHTGRVYLMAHSLGAELIMRMAAMRLQQQQPLAGQSRVPDSEAPNATRAAGVALLAPVGLRPHAAVRPQWLIHALAHGTYIPGIRFLVRNYLWAFYVYLLGLGNKKRLTVTEVEWCQRRILERHYARYASDCRSIVTVPFFSDRQCDRSGKSHMPAGRTADSVLSGLPTAMFFSNDDDAVEEPISTELAAALELGHPDYAPTRFAVQYFFGGHMLAKSQAGHIAGEIKEWLAACEDLYGPT